MKKSVLCSVATLGGVGRFYGSGTLASLLTLPVVVALSYVSLAWYVLFTVFVFFLSLKASAQASAYYGKQDPPEVVIDEVVGCLVTFLAIPYAPQWLILGFVLFRFFDITKWCGVNFFSKLRGAPGVVLDDVAAGILSNVILQILLSIGW